MKYKLIKEYPGLPKFCIEGTIITDTNPTNGAKDGWFDINWGKSNTMSFILGVNLHPQLYPAFWEEIKEQQFKVGDWVVILTSDSCSYVVGDVHRINNITSDGRLNTDNGNGWTFEHFRLATTEEIEKHLKAEAERRGFKEGIKFKGVTHPKGKVGNKVTCEKLYFAKIHSDNLGCYLYANNEYIYLDGQWAEIVKEEEIKIGEYTANFGNDTIAFGCKRYTNSEVINLYNDCLTFGIQQILLHDHKVEFEVIKQIYDKLKG